MWGTAWDPTGGNILKGISISPAWVQTGSREGSMSVLCSEPVSLNDRERKSTTVMQGQEGSLSLAR